jgi:hypothetical protein
VDERRLHVPDEHTWFILLGMPFVAPAMRDYEFYLDAIQRKVGHQWGNPADHLINVVQLVSQPTLFSLDAAIRHEEARLTDDAPTTPKRIHPVTVTRWTPELTARYADQVQQESIAQFERRAVTLRQRAGGDRRSHYWAEADRALATASRLRGVQL